MVVGGGVDAFLVDSSRRVGVFGVEVEGKDMCAFCSMCIEWRAKDHGY